jgi:drug/metabolite transporter (DMT)-like permease
VDAPAANFRMGLLNLFVVYLVWGSTFLAIGEAVRGPHGAAPAVLGAVRMVLGGAILAAVARLAGSSLKLPWRELLWAALAGVLLWDGANGIIMVVEQHVATGYAALMMGLVPLVVGGVDVATGRRRLTPLLGAGLGLGFLGLVVLSGAGGSLGPGGIANLGLLLLAALMQATSLVVQHTRLERVPPMVSAAWQEWFAAPLFIAVALSFRQAWPTWDLVTGSAAVYLVVVGALAYASFAAAARHLPLTLAGTYAFVNPVIAVVLGSLVLDEHVGVPTIAGGMLLLLGVAAVLRASARPKPGGTGAALPSTTTVS